MIKFGTGGWRAIIGDEFTKNNIIKVAAGLSLLMIEEKVTENGIVLGYDRRFLSKKASEWMAEVFAGYGIHIYLTPKEVPTPLVMYMVDTLGCAYGTSVTASHNPADYNGIKIFTKGGKDADLEVTKRIEKYIETLQEEDIKSISFNAGIELGSIEIIDCFNGYIDKILSMIDLEKIKERRLKLLIDPMYGVAKNALQTVLITSRCDVDVINDRHDTNFGGRMPSPSKTTLSKLMYKVVEGNYDLGIGTDGDADRLGIINESGEYVTANEILSVLYYYLLKYKNWQGDVVRNLATTHLLDKIAESFSMKCYEVPVGFKYISQKMEETDAIIGGESSGGLTIKGHIKGKDGVFASALLIEMISVTGMGIKEMINHLQQIYGKSVMVEANLTFDEDNKEDLKKKLFIDNVLPQFPYSIEKVSHLDGLKVYFENGGWVVVRFSGTEPLLRIFAEMATKEEATTIINSFKNVI